MKSFFEAIRSLKTPLVFLAIDRFSLSRILTGSPGTINSGVWIDSDAVRLRPFGFSTDIFYGWERHDQVNGTVVGARPGVEKKSRVNGTTRRGPSGYFVGSRGSGPPPNSLLS